jgi:hypothetical protein
VRKLIHIITAQGEEHLAQLLVPALERAGLEVSHEGKILVGDSVIGEQSRLVASGVPIVLCGTVRAVGSRWAHKLVNAAHATTNCRVYVVQMEEDAYLDQLSLNTHVARYDRDPGQASVDLISALLENYPDAKHGRGTSTGPVEHYLDESSGETSFEPEELRWFRAQLRSDNKERYPDSLSAQEFLARTGALLGSSLTRAGVLLFGSRPDRLLPTAMIQCSHYDGIDRSAPRQVIDITGPITRQIIAAHKFIADRVAVGEGATDTQAQAAPIYRYPMKAVREVIANAVAHRRYDNSDSCVYVRLFDDRIEILSPGDWAARPTPEGPINDLSQLECESKCRNFRLARLLAAVSLFEGEGSGIPTALADCRHSGAPEPKVRREVNSVTVILRPGTRHLMQRTGEGSGPRSILPPDLARTLAEVDVGSTSKDDEVFRTQYLRAAMRRFDILELFGVDSLARRSRLSDVFVELPVRVKHAAPRGAEPRETISEQLSMGSRLLVEGEAGSGKSTLLQWIALNAARQALHNDAEDQVPALTPFLIQIRRSAWRTLPTPDEFVDAITPELSAALPPGWVHRVLGSGSAVILVDGLDEVVAEQREDVRVWLNMLLASFPQARCMVTSRPTAVRAAWLQDLNFVTVGIAPMSTERAEEFVETWYASIPDSHLTASARARESARLVRLISMHRFLQDLASSPMTCALLCALSYDRSGNLPSSRTELYRAAVDMLTSKRDAERGIVVMPNLPASVTQHMLADFAYWLTRNDLAESTTDQLVQRLHRLGPSLPLARYDIESIYQYLIERTGLLRETAPGRISFIHRTFQEYLAATAAADEGDLGLLVDNAHHTQWREVVIMACAQASPRARDELLRQLIARIESGDDFADKVLSVLHECVEESPTLSPELREHIEQMIAAARQENGQDG